MSSKSSLKSAKAALDTGDFAEAIIQARHVLEKDPQNYFASVFLGRASEKQGNLDDAAKAYEKATIVKPDEDLAWKGLCNVYEAQGVRTIEKYVPAALALAQIYAERSDHHECQTCLDKVVGLARNHGTRADYKHALDVYLPTSPVYDFLEGRIQYPSLTYQRLAEITEAEDQERINKEVGERRTRLGAKLSNVQSDVTREVYNKSNLEDLYLQFISWSKDDDERSIFEEKLLQRAFNHLAVLLDADKAAKRTQVIRLAHDMVIIKRPFELAWKIYFEWRDISDLSEFDRTVLVDYATLFPLGGLSSVLRAYFELQIDQTKISAEGDTSAEQEAERTALQSLSVEERLLLIQDGLDDAISSALAHRLGADYYLQIEEYESSIETSRKALHMTQIETTISGLVLQDNRDCINTVLATSLIYHQSPKNHPEAETLFNSILSRKPNLTSALLGVGLVLEDQEQFEEALSFFTRALEKAPTNIRVQAEAAWCNAQTGNLDQGLQDLRFSLDQMNASKVVTRDAKALTLYRIGKCTWELYPDKVNRKSRKGAYSYFISAIKANPNLASSYTSLGLYYEEYAKDKQRARQCYQKAFELSASEVVAAERLATGFADDDQGELVEMVAQRTIDSGIAKPAPGSKRKGLSWPFAALGIVKMNRQDYPGAVVSFQAALRIDPNDYNSWVGLGESYHSSGRYNAAQKTLEHAQTLLEDDQKEAIGWFAHYMLSNVHRELGSYDEAIAGYRAVLSSRPGELGIAIALLQSLTDRAWLRIQTGFFGEAAASAQEALIVAQDMNNDHSQSFNFWKTVGDACALFAWIPGMLEIFPLTTMQQIFESSINSENTRLLTDVDRVDLQKLHESEQNSDQGQPLEQCLIAGILAHKLAVHVSSSDIHAQAVAWYNLGWTEYQAFSCLSKTRFADEPGKGFSQFLKASVRCFKRAIELEARNADFWAALGVATTTLNPKVAQHSFVRSLHLNERSSSNWTNLGALYMLQDDHELAHHAFARAQSSDPEYPNAWLGEGLIALLTGDLREALSHFTHAVEISDATSLPVKIQYVASSFDHILASASIRDSDLSELIQPIFAAKQLTTQTANVTRYRHLLALLNERVGDHEAALQNLLIVCADYESQYEKTESQNALAQFVHSKSDLARNQVALRSFDDAIESIDIVLSLSEEAESMQVLSRQKARLSAHMTAGLAHYNLDAMPDALSGFQAALKESKNDPDVVCLLVQVLWVQGGEQNRRIAKDQLFDCIEKHEHHAGLTLLLGAMAALDDDDTETRDAVLADLQTLRTQASLRSVQRDSIETLLLISAALHASSGSKTAEAARSIMVAPNQPQGWSEMTEVSDMQYPAEMALKAAIRSVPPRGELSVDELSRAYCGTGIVRDAQRSVVLCPWQISSWQVLQSCIQ